MKRLAKLSLASLLATAACATDTGPASGGGDDGSGSDTTPPPRTLDATGTYRVHSTFDVATNMPTMVGTVVNDVIAATDGPDDPMHWVLDQTIAALPDGDFKDLLSAAVPFVAPMLNDQVTQLAPDVVATFTRIGHDIADVSKHLGINEKLAINGADQSYAGVVTADGIHITVEGHVSDLAFVDYQLENVVADAVGINLDVSGRMSIGEHHLPLSYGKIIRMALDAAIIPAIDPTAHNLGEFLTHLIDCNAVGQKINDAIGFGGQALWAGACTGGLQIGAQAIYGQIVNIDSSLLDFDLNGTATAVDANGDYLVDRLDNGAWAGTLVYATTPAALGTATFDGKRM